MDTKDHAPPPPYSHIQQIVQAALAEDLGCGDLTSNCILSESMTAKARILTKEDIVVAGLAVAKEVFHQIDDTLTLTFHHRDGDRVPTESRLLTITGKAQSLLQAERVALNFLQHLSGISTFTHQCCLAVHDNSVKITDTRKTTPGLRALEKWAVRLGGGFNHRSSLHDGILIKDNHLMILAAHKITLTQACLLTRQRAPHGLRISVEVETLAQVRQALQGKADIILLDNMPVSRIQQAVKIIQGQAIVEVSGGITMNNIRDMANTGADILSIGALTHSAPSMNLSMDIIPLRAPLKRTSR